uniref:Uncharacterized protein n=1 Tax=Arundo donax TaxID=35708 RepID=A0A0A8Z9A2_ARUDO
MQSLVYMLSIQSDSATQKLRIAYKITTEIHKLNASSPVWITLC